MTEERKDTVESERPVPAALILFALAFLVRAIYLVQSLNSPFFGAPFLDEQYFYEWASRIGQGELAYHTAFFRAPLYAYLLGSVFAITGPNFFVPKILQHLLGSVVAVLVFKIGEKCFDRRTAWVAGLMAALYPPMIFFEGEILDISLQCFFYPALLLIGIASLRDPQWRWTILFGIVAGLAAISRPNVLLLVGLWLLLQLAAARRWGGWKPAVLRAAATVGLVVVCTIPLLIHNIMVDRSWVPISTYAGINFYIGNRPQADGYTASTPRRYEFFGPYRDSVELFAQREAERLLGRSLSGAEVQRYWIGRTLDEAILGDPVHVMSLFWKKFVLFWNGYEIRNNKDIYFALNYTPALKCVHWVWNCRVLSPLALLGLILAAWRYRNVETLWLALAVVAHMISVILFFVSDRYRLPAAPVLILFAALAVTTAISLVREKRWLAVGASLLGLATFGAFANIPWYDMSPAIPHKDIWNVANAHKLKGELEKAADEYRRFVELNPDFVDGWNNLGETLVRIALQSEAPDQQKLREAERCFERAIAADATEQMSLPWSNLGYCRLKLGDPEGALAAYEEALARVPDNRLAQVGRADALAALERPDEALAALDRLLDAEPAYVPALLTKASVLAREGRTQEAFTFLNRAHRLAPAATAAEIRTDPFLSSLIGLQTP